MFRWCFSGVTTILSWRAPYQETGLYPQAIVLDSAGDVVATVNLTANATLAYIYEGSWTPSSEGEYRVSYQIYTDSGRTTLSEVISGMDEFVRVKKIPSREMAVMGGATPITDNEIKKIADLVADKIWQTTLDNGLSAEKTLITRSDFDFEENKVKTDIKIPEVNLMSLENKIEDIKEMKKDIKKEMIMWSKEKNKSLENILKKLNEKDNNFGLILNEVNLVNEKIEKMKNDYQEMTNSLIINVDKKMVQLQENVKSFNNLYEHLKIIDLKTMDKNELLNLIVDVQVNADKLNKLTTDVLKEIETNNKMMEALNREDNKRFKIILEALNLSSQQIKSEADKIKLDKIFNGFAIINNKMKYEELF